MKMKVLTGHLTRTEKKSIKTILEANLMSGRVGRKDYILSKEGGIYTVKTYEVDRSIVIGTQIAEHKSTFTLQ